MHNKTYALTFTCDLGMFVYINVLLTDKLESLVMRLD